MQDWCVRLASVVDFVCEVVRHGQLWNVSRVYKYPIKDKSRVNCRKWPIPLADGMHLVDQTWWLMILDTAQGNEHPSRFCTYLAKRLQRIMPSETHSCMSIGEAFCTHIVFQHRILWVLITHPSIWSNASPGRSLAWFPGRQVCNDCHGSSRLTNSSVY